MQLEVPNLMENELAKQMEDDLRRLLAGTDIRANGTAITADSLDANIKNLFSSNFYEVPKSNGAFEPTVTGANNSASVKSAASGNGNGNGGAPAPSKSNPDIDLPAGLRKLTGANTVGEFLGQGVQAVAGGALMAINPLAGLAFKGAVSVAEGANLGDTVANIATSLNPFSSMAVKALGAVGAYDRAEGLLTSASDAYQTINNSSHVPTTLAGRNVINAQVEAAKKATGHYDSSSSLQQRASQAALNKDNAPAYAKPGYGASLSNAKNPAKTGGSDSSKSYQSAGGITSTKSSAGHAPAGGVGPSPSKSSPSKGGSNGSSKSSNTSKSSNSKSSGSKSSSSSGSKSSGGKSGGSSKSGKSGGK